MNVVKVSMLVTALVVSVGFPATPAKAQQGEGPCRADAERLCKGVQPGGGRVRTCLKEHQAELSAACKDRIQRARAERHERQWACKADVEKLCQGVQAGEGRIRKCLKEHEAELSAACRAELSEKSGKQGSAARP